MSTTISPAERARFLQALREDPDFRNAVRSQVLSEELLGLPERFAQFAAYVNAFIEEQKATNEEVRAFIDEQKATNEEVRAFIDEQKATNEEVRAFIDEQKATNEEVRAFIDEQKATNEEQRGVNEEVRAFIDEQKTTNEEQRGFNEEVRAFIDEQKATNDEQRRFNARTDASIGILKGNAARRLLRDHHETILELLRLDFVRTLGRDDLTRMVRNSGVATEIEFGQRRSFYSADLVLEGVDTAGDIHYVAAEASFTADRRDTDRALRNAEFLTRFTGRTAHPIVASVINDHAVQELVDEGAIRWFQLDERELEAD